MSWAPTGEAAPPSGAEAQCKPSHSTESPRLFLETAGTFLFSPLQVVIAPNLITKPVSPISCVMQDPPPPSAFIGQCGLRRQRSHLGSHTQKQVGRGSLGPKPGPVRTGETPAQRGHLASVTAARQSRTRGARTQSLLSRSFFGTGAEAQSACSLMKGCG